MAITNWTKDYPLEMDVAYIGKLRHHEKITTYLNSSGDVAQVTEIDVGTAANSTLYSIRVDRYSIGYTSDADATVTEIRDGLLSAIKGSPAVSGLVIAEAADIDTLRLTVRVEGEPVSIATNGGGAGFGINTTNSIESAQTGEVPFGRAVARRAGDQHDIARLPTQPSDVFVGISVATGARELALGVKRQGLISTMERGEVWIECESPVTPESQVYYRHTASGSLNQFGIFAGSSGAGLTQLSFARFKENSIALPDGRHMVPISINLP